MFKWIKITDNQYLGVFLLGIILFILQQLPYIIMPLIPLKSNVLMDMKDKVAVLNIAEKMLGVGCVIVMLFLVKCDVKWFSLENKREIIGFSIMLATLISYYIGWIFYFKGFQSLPLILTLLVAMPPLFYTFMGIWRGNNVLSIMGIIFLIVHISNVWLNLGGAK